MGGISPAPAAGTAFYQAQVLYSGAFDISGSPQVVAADFLRFGPGHYQYSPAFLPTQFDFFAFGVVGGGIAAPNFVCVNPGGLPTNVLEIFIYQFSAGAFAASDQSFWLCFSGH